MTQKPLASAVMAQTPSGTLTLEQVDALSNLKVTDAGDTSLTTSGPLNAATQVTVAAGKLKSASNLLPAGIIATLTTSQIGTFYDALVTSGVGSLTTSQVATLSTSQICGLITTEAVDQGFGGGNGVPVKNGLVFVPAPAGQVVNVLKK